MLVEADSAGLLRPENVRHLEYAAFVADPFKAVSELYAHFDLPLGNAAGARIRAFMAERPSGRYSHNPTRLEDYGLSAPGAAGSLSALYGPFRDCGRDGRAGDCAKQANLAAVRRSCR